MVVGMATNNLSLVSIAETPTTYSKSAGNRRLGWFCYPGSQWILLSDGSQKMVPRGVTPLQFCSDQGIDTQAFRDRIAMQEEQFQAQCLARQQERHFPKHLRDLPINQSHYVS
jgi:hypothetical protein